MDEDRSSLGHNSSPDGEAQMQARYRKRKERIAQQQALKAPVQKVVVS